MTDQFSPTRYVRVVFDPTKIAGQDGSAARPIFLQVTAERRMHLAGVSFEALIGREVDREADDLGRLHVIDKGTVKRLTEYRQSMTYGNLQRVRKDAE